MAQDKIKYTDMDIKEFAKLIEKQLNTTNSLVIENVRLLNELKPNEKCIGAELNDNAFHHINVNSTISDIVHNKVIEFKNCKLHNARIIIENIDTRATLHVVYTNCQIVQFDIRRRIGEYSVFYTNCAVYNCAFYNASQCGSQRVYLTAVGSTTFKYCLFERCDGSQFTHNNGETFISCKFDNCDFVGCELDKVTFDDCRCDIRTRGFQLVCPETGEYTAFKKAYAYIDKNGKSATSEVIKHKNAYFFKWVPVIIKLRIPADALRSSATTRKCRASKAEVLSITSIDGKKRYKKAIAGRHYAQNYFAYEVGKTVVPTNGFEQNRWIECAPGIHHFITRGEAVDYEL